MQCHASGTIVSMTKRLSREHINNVLQSLTEARTRELCIAGLRRWYTNPGRPNNDLDVASDLLWGGLLKEVHDGEHVIAAIDVSAGLHLTDPFMTHVVEFVSWFVRAGFGWPLGAEIDRFPRKLHLTASGQRLLGRPDHDHPMLPGFVERLAKRCHALPDAVISALVDATACLDHGLTRPAIVLVGVAYEIAVEHVVDSLVSRSMLSATVASEG
jgi:hypothetical protein